MQKKLYRIMQGKMLCGVCTGFADYFSLDVSIVRLLVIVASLVSLGVGLFGYIAAALILPEKPTGGV